MENSVISQNDELLTREASMASMSLGVGLTLIRKYDFAQLGFFYSSLYSITTGIERLLKLIFIYDHRIRNNDQFPDNGCLKKLGHKLETLYNIAVGINDHYKFDVAVHGLLSQE